MAKVSHYETEIVIMLIRVVAFVVSSRVGY